MEFIDMKKIMNDIKTEYGKQLKEARLALGLSPEQVAVELGVTASTINHNESGRSFTKGLQEFYELKLKENNITVEKTNNKFFI